MRITKEHKLIIRKQLTRQVFQKKHDSIVRKIIEQLNEATTELFKSNHDRAIALGKENVDLLSNRTYKLRAENISIASPRFRLLDESSANLDRLDKIRSDSLSFFITPNKSYVESVNLSNKQIASVTRQQKRLYALHDEYCDFLSNLTQVLASVNTKKQLEELLPEAVDFLPEPEKKLPIPTETAKRIRQLIKKTA